jgi:hypothetical protein
MIRELAASGFASNASVTFFAAIRSTDVGLKASIWVQGVLQSQLAIQHEAAELLGAPPRG